MIRFINHCHPGHWDKWQIFRFLHAPLPHPGKQTKTRLLFNAAMAGYTFLLKIGLHPGYNLFASLFLPKNKIWFYHNNNNA